MNHTILNVMFTIVPLFIICVFIFTFALIISPKLRGKLMAKQMKATKYMVREVKDDLTEIGSTVGNVAIKTKENILNQNEQTLNNLSTKQANIYKEGIEITTRAIHNGLKNNTIYCKYCGKTIDNDSIFCKYCGKKQS